MGGVDESGPRPFSEREARIARALILRLHPHLTVWFHQHLDMVWASGGDRRIEKVFARVSGLPYHPMPQLAGSAISWQNNTLPDTTAFAAELPAGQPSPAAVTRYVPAVLAAALTRLSRTLLLTLMKERQLLEIDWLSAGAAAAGPAAQNGLEEQHRLRQRQTGRRTFGSSRSSVRKACAQVTSAQWWWKPR